MSELGRLTVRFWGIRGSIPAPGPATVRYGGNTPCVEIRPGERLLIMDCGSGLRELGLALLKQGGPVSADILLSHTHWDHIQGFPFFSPAFVPGNCFAIHAYAGSDISLEQTLAGQMEYRYFPVSLDHLAASISYVEVRDGRFSLGPAKILTERLNHPSPTVGYRVEYGGRAVAYCTDTEPPARPRPDKLILDPHVLKLARDVDLLIHDAQYTDAEYPAKVGWGHSSVEYAVEVAAAAGAKKLALFHMDPTRSDDAVDALLALGRARAAEISPDLEVMIAAEGLDLTL